MSLSDDVTYGHSAHEEEETYPWHVRTFDMVGNSVGSSGINDQGPKPRPHIIYADKVENRNAVKGQNGSAEDDRVPHTR